MRVHLQTEECRIMSMNDSHVDSNQCHLQALKELKEQVANLKSEFGMITKSYKHWRAEAVRLIKKVGPSEVP